MLRKRFMKPMTPSKIVMQNEEILLKMLSDMLHVEKDSLATTVEVSKIQGDMAVSLREMSNALQEIAYKLPFIDDDEITRRH